MKTLAISCWLFAIGFISCTNDIKPLAYGNASCANCKMLLADKHFGAEILTKTGKIYVFDSFECMVNFKNEYLTDESQIDKIVMADASKEGSLIDARSALYLHSRNFPSPMGAYISAFADENSFTEFKSKYPGSKWSYSQATDSVLNKNY